MDIDLEKFIAETRAQTEANRQGGRGKDYRECRRARLGIVTTDERADILRTWCKSNDLSINEVVNQLIGALESAIKEDRRKRLIEG